MKHVILILLFNVLATNMVYAQSKNLKTRVLKSYEKAEITRLQSQINSLDKLSDVVFSSDRSRIYILKLANLKIIELIKQQGMLNQNTSLAYQSYILRYRFSHDLFKHIKLEQSGSVNKKVEQSIDNILTIFSTTEEERGLNGSNLYSHFTEDIFKQIKDLLFNATKTEGVNKNLKNIFNTLIVPTGNLLAKAKQGDRPSVFAEGRKLYDQYRVFYPQFLKEQNEKNFDIVFQIQGLLELYYEFAEIQWQKNNTK